MPGVLATSAPLTTATTPGLARPGSCPRARRARAGRCRADCPVEYPRELQVARVNRPTGHFLKPSRRGTPLPMTAYSVSSAISLPSPIAQYSQAPRPSTPASSVQGRAREGGPYRAARENPGHLALVPFGAADIGSRVHLLRRARPDLRQQPVTDLLAPDKVVSHQYGVLDTEVSTSRRSSQVPSSASVTAAATPRQGQSIAESEVLEIGGVRAWRWIGHDDLGQDLARLSAVMYRPRKNSSSGRVRSPSAPRSGPRRAAPGGVPGGSRR